MRRIYSLFILSTCYAQSVQHAAPMVGNSSPQPVINSPAVGGPMQPSVISMQRPAVSSGGPMMPSTNSDVSANTIGLIDNLPNHMKNYDFTTTAEEQMITKHFIRKPPNKSSMLFLRFPKSGSTTLKALFNLLAKKTLYNLEDDHEHNTETLDNYVLDIYKRSPSRFFALSRTFFLKFHYWLNVTAVSNGQFKQPTMVTMLPEPIEWFSSKYYSCRHGHARNPEVNGACKTGL